MEQALRTIGDQLRTLRSDMQNQCLNANYAKLGNLAMDGKMFLILSHEIRTWSEWHHTVQGQRMTEITRRILFRFKKPSCSRSLSTGTSWIVVGKEIP